MAASAAAAGGGQHAHGGFGGGGGGNSSGGGGGGFGGGGGGGDQADRDAGSGFGAGMGNHGGGGGLGAGGDIFVMQGATLTISGGTVGQGSVTAGQSQGDGASGQAYGKGIFIQGNESVTFGTGQTSAQTTTISGDITDQSGSDTANTYNQPASGHVVVAGDGTVVLGGNNSFTGGLKITGGTLRAACRNLAAPIGDHFVDVHVELGAAARHPHVQREHVMMLSGEDFIANLHDQLVTLIVEPLAGVICRSGGLLQGGICGDHFAWNEISADAEVLERALGLSAPQLVRRDLQPPRGCLVPLACRPWDFSRVQFSFRPVGPNTGPAGIEDRRGRHPADLVH